LIFRTTIFPQKLFYEQKPNFRVPPANMNIAAAMYYKWSKAFLESGKNGLTLDTKRDATTDEVRYLKEENQDLKKAVAELHLEVQRYKKSIGM
jgi:hypothetical protein